MSAEEPTTPEERTPKVSPAKTWKELEGRTGGDAIEDEKPAPSQIKSKDKEENGRKRLRSRRARFGVAGFLAVLVVTLASIVVASLVGGDPARRSRPPSGAVHAKRREAEKQRVGRARWVREAGRSSRPRQRRTAPGRSRARRHVRPRHKPRRPAQQPATSPAQSPESVPASPERAPAPSAPAPAAPSEPKQEPGPRDGATESTEFGL
jgi:hypothetical protein